MRKPKHRSKHIRGGRFFAIALSGLALWTLAGCESLLEVELPGSVLEADLNNPSLANTLVLGVQSDFECGFGAWMQVMLLWTSTMDTSATTTTAGNIQTRRVKTQDYGQGNCAIDGSPLPFSFWGPLHISRTGADRAIKLIEGFDTEVMALNEQSNPDFLFGKAHAYAGYSIQLLAESFCELYFDAGPLETRAQGWERAVLRFDAALTFLAKVPAGDDDFAEATSLTNMALVGRARANLYLGNDALVLADAALVDVDFVRMIDRSNLNDFRRNRTYDQSNKDRARSVSNLQSMYREVELSMTVHGKVADHWTLLIDGVPGIGDPRVVSTGPTTGSNGHTPLYKQAKYKGQDSPIPFTSWKEAQLMIAELDPAQSVAIINTLRDYYPGLPDYVETDAALIAAQVLEERRRELWLQGNRMGDLLRYDGMSPQFEWATDVTPAGQTIVESTPHCMITQVAETDANPNAA
jgi:hypothetical protein